MNKNLFGISKHVGIGTLPLRNAFPSRNTLVEFTVNLVHNTKNKSTPKGAAILRATLVDPNANKQPNVQQNPSPAPDKTNTPTNPTNPTNNNNNTNNNTNNSTKNQETPQNQDSKSNESSVGIIVIVSWM